MEEQVRKAAEAEGESAAQRSRTDQASAPVASAPARSKRSAEEDIRQLDPRTDGLDQHRRRDLGRLRRWSVQVRGSR